jgi:hypothetical protein
LPFTHFLLGFLKLYQMGAPIKDVMPEFLRLTLMIVISVSVTMLALRYRFRSLAASSSETIDTQEGSHLS